MTITGLKETVISFYEDNDKVTFGFACLVLSQLIGFVPHVPQFVIYVVFIFYSGYILLQGWNSLNTNLITFIIYIPIQLFIVSPDPMFKSWERYLLFTLLLICTSPLIQGEKQSIFRDEIFKIILSICIVIGVTSFVAKFIGVNYMTYMNVRSISVGLFSGVTTHSMLLGPVSGIGVLACIWLGIRKNSKFFGILAIMCLGAVMFSASRSSLMATIGGIVVMSYKMSGSSSKFVRIVILISLLASLSFPIWGNALDAVIAKNNGNIAAGSAFSSRENLWYARILEFENDPLFGSGFDAINLDVARMAGGFDSESGMVESGSSWLIILSMTGIIGAIIIIPLLINSFLQVYRSQDEYGFLILGILTLFYIHMIAEGYIYYGGSLLAFMLWTTIGVAYNYRYYNNSMII